MSALRLNPSAYVDSFARDGLPPLEQWPVLLLDGVHAYPTQLNAAQRLLDDAVAEGHGERIAIISPTGNGEYRQTTYRQLQQLADWFAHVLVKRLGMVTGNRILLRGYNGPMLAAAWLGVLKAGGIAVTTMPMLRAKELRTVMQKAACRIALCDARLEAELKQAAADAVGFEASWYWNGENGENGETIDSILAQLHEPFTTAATSSDDVCLIAFTSGTTGEPKGCMHFHRDVMAMCDAFSSHVLRPVPTDRCIGTPPLAFTFGLGGLLAFPLHARAATVLLESGTPELLLETIAATRATITFTAPTFYRLMALAIDRERARFDTSSLRISVSAGEALPDATRTLWRDATGVEMLDGIGATELIHIFIAAAGVDVRPGAIGRAVPGYQVVVVDENLVPVSAGEVGRLAVRGPTGCRYLRDVRQASYVQNGWNLTGDAGTMDADGYVYFKSRTDDLIISSGYNIGAPEVESAVLTHPAVAECAVVGVPDVDRGQCIKAFVVLKSGEAASRDLARAIQDHVKQTIAPYKYPRLIEFRDTLPRTETGKLQRYRLKEQ